MSDMIINDSVPVDKKWNELIKYNIFIMKLVEFVLSLILLLIPFAMGMGGTSMSHCIAVSPTLVLSVMFVILYLVDQVHELAEQLYIVVQLIILLLAILNLFLDSEPFGPMFGLFYVHLFFALIIDFYCVVKSKGLVLFS